MTKTFLKVFLFNFKTFIPFKALIGLTDDNKKAGYIAVSKTVITSVPVRISHMSSDSGSNSKYVLKWFLKTGRIAIIIAMDMTRARKQVRMDSMMNW